MGSWGIHSSLIYDQHIKLFMFQARTYCKLSIGYIGVHDVTFLQNCYGRRMTD